MAVRILHAHSTFALGGKEARAVRLMNAFGDAAEHVVLSATPGALSARASVDPAVRVAYPSDAPSLAGLPGPLRLLRLARYMRRFDLVLTYNWGAFDAVMAHQIFGGPPLIHHEDGFNSDEAERLKSRRNIYRRIGLAGAHRLVVPSRQLRRIAQNAWGQPPHRVELIPNGVPVADYSAAPEKGAIPGFEPREGELVVGTLAGLRPVKNLTRLVRAFAAMETKAARLVIVGEGPESERIVAEARRLGVADRLHLPGFLPRPARYLGLFDMFAISSDSEHFARRGDGGGACRGGDGSGRHPAHGVPGQSPADRRAGRRSRARRGAGQPCPASGSQAQYRHRQPPQGSGRI
jgi:glycosyltransferase involved in cell wall biosynthesis